MNYFSFWANCPVGKIAEKAAELTKNALLQTVFFWRLGESNISIKKFNENL